MQNVSFPQIVDQLYKVFSNEAEASQYNNTQSGAQYMGLCGWAGTMSPLNRAAFLKEFGQDVTDRAEAEARVETAITLCRAAGDHLPPALTEELEAIRRAVAIE